MESLLRLARETREALMPLQTVSHFDTRGILTPDEFVLAGDNLVGKYPGLWKWGTTRDANMRKSYLPVHKQFVYMKGASCLFRVNDAVPDQEDSDWQAVESVRASPSYGHRGEQAGDDDDDDDDDDYREAANKPQLGAKKSGQEEKQEEEEERRSDLAALLFDLEDPSVFADFGEMQSHAAAGEVRKYDISLTYDNFYRGKRPLMSVRLGSSNTPSFLLP